MEDALRIRYRLPTGTVSDVIGTRDFEDNTMSADTATISVRARFSNPNGLLVPTAMSPCWWISRSRQKRLSPQEALLTDGEGRFVYVVDEAGIVQRCSHRRRWRMDGWRCVPALRRENAWWCGASRRWAPVNR